MSWEFDRAYCGILPSQIHAYPRGSTWRQAIQDEILKVLSLEAGEGPVPAS